VESVANWIKGVHAEDRDFVLAALDRAAKSGQIDIRYRLVPKRSTPRLIRAQGSATDAGRKLVGISINLTEQQRARLQLQAQQEITNTLEHWTTLQDVSSRILQLMCETQHWEIGNLWTLDSQSERLQLFQSWGQKDMEPAVKALGEAHSFEKGVGLPGRVWASGKPLWITDVSQDGNFPRLPIAQKYGICSVSAFPIFLGGEFFGVMEFFSKHRRREDPEIAALLRAVGSQLGQVIERRKAERELRDSEERHRSISETASDAILTIDENSTIIFANAAVEKVFGYGVDEVLGKSITVLMPDSQQNSQLSGLKRYLHTARKHIAWKGVEMHGRHKNGSELQLELSFGEFEKNGKHFFTGVARDISARKLAENALKTSEKLAATGRLAASMAHEINNPLTSVTNILYLLNSDPSISPANQKLVEAAQQEIGRVSHIVKQTLGFYRVSNEPIETDLMEIVDGVFELFASQIKAKGIRLDRDYRNPSKIHGLPGELRQVISNLIDNAIQAVSRGGSLIVRLKDAIEVRNPHRPGVRLLVADTGAGIEPESRNRLFEPFFTTKGEKGTGLGLWVSRGIIAKHGGSIRFRTCVQPGRSGTVFSVFLPLASPLALPKVA
jgi:PAS domain S-box-containing protein